MTNPITPEQIAATVAKLRSGVIMSFNFTGSGGVETAQDIRNHAASMIETLAKERDGMLACCDSYAEENQRLSDERGAALAIVSAANERIAKMHEALLDALAGLIAATSLLKRGSKKAAPSDKMFDQMVADYESAAFRARAALQEKNDD